MQEWLHKTEVLVWTKYLEDKEDLYVNYKDQTN